MKRYKFIYYKLKLQLYNKKNKKSGHNSGLLKLKDQKINGKGVSSAFLFQHIFHEHNPRNRSPVLSLKTAQKYVKKIRLFFSITLTGQYLITRLSQKV